MKRFLITIVLAVLFMGSCTGIWLGISPSKNAHPNRWPVKDKPPGEFPVLFLTSTGKDAKPYVIGYSKLDGFKKEFPDYTLLVPLGQEDALNRSLYSRSGAAHEGNTDYEHNENFEQRFKVERLPDGRQRLEVNGSEDDRTVLSWYIASAHDIQPEHYEHHRGPENYQTVFYLPVAVGITTVLFLVGRNFWRRRAKAASV